MVAVPFYFAALLRQLKVFTDQERMDKKSTGFKLSNCHVFKYFQMLYDY